ncbi:MAG: TonB-dependent receptor [Acidobacteriota bacterium]
MKGTGLLTIIRWVTLSVLTVQTMVFPPTSLAQSTFGTLIGTVTDSSGAVVVGATVVITNQRTQATRTILTDTAGSYQAANLDAGVYHLATEATGFQRQNRKDIELLARQTVRLDVRLEVGAAESQEIEVTDSVGVITTETPTIADSKSGREINELALNFRATENTSPLAVATLVPGVQRDPDNQISISGLQPYTTSASIDGITTLNVRLNGPVPELFPSVEGIEEFKVSSINNSAEFAQASDITTTSKSGSNILHGTAYWFHQNRALNATDPFAPVDPANPSRRLKPALIANSFGGAFSGPLTIPRAYRGTNRSFFFFDYEGVRLPSQSTLRQVVPPDAFRRGDLSSIPTPIVDPFTGQPYPNNQIPINPTSAKALELLFPKQNQPTGARLDVPNFVTNVPGSFSINGVDVRGDHVFGASHKMFARYTHKNTSRDGTNGSGDYNTLAGTYSRPIHVRNLAGSYNWIVSPNLINEFRAGYSLADFDNTYPLAGQGKDIIRQLGIPNLPSSPPQGGLPYFSFNDGSITVSSSPGLTNPISSKSIVFGDNLTWIKGAHTVKVGADVQRVEAKDISGYNTGDDYGEYYFNSGTPGVASYSGNAFADFLLGLPIQTAKALNGPDFNPYSTLSSYFIQDDWKVTRRLTLNFGLRYELHPPFNDKTRQLANFDRNFAGGRVVVQDLNLISPAFRKSIGNTPIVSYQEAGLPETLRRLDKSNFNPRFGFAYRLSDNNDTVIRGGFGIYTITILGRVLYSLEGVANGSFLSFTNTSPAQVRATGSAALRFPNVFPEGTGDAGGLPDYRRANPFDFRDPYSMQWNLTVERNLGWSTGVRLTYNGQRQIDLVHSPDINQVRANTIGYQSARDQRPFKNFNAVLDRANGASGKYHALTTEITKRFSRGLSFQNSYVWAKNLSNANGVAPRGFSAENGPTTLDFFDIAQDYGDVAFTRRHRFVSTFLWELPIGQGRPFASGIGRAADALIGGWQVAGIVTLQTGPYLTPFFRGADPSGTGANVRGVQPTQRPDRIGNGNLSNPSPERYFDRSAFVVPADNIGRFGNAGVGILRGPGTEVFSISLAKRFLINERVNLRYEATMSNLFNHTNLDIPSTLNIGSGSFGQIQATQKGDLAGPRTIQMSLRVSF